MNKIPVYMLIGRDATHLHKIESCREYAPYAVETLIGWAMIGSVCGVTNSKISCK